MVSLLSAAARPKSALTSVYGLGIEPSRCASGTTTVLTSVSEVEVFCRSDCIASSVSAPGEVFKGSSRAGWAPASARSQDEVSAKLVFFPTRTIGELAIDGTAIVGTDSPSSAWETHSDESGIHRSGRSSPPPASARATLAAGVAVIVNCRHGTPSLPPLADSDLAAVSSEGWSSGAVVSLIWVGSEQALPPRIPSAPASEPKDRTTKTPPIASTSSPTAVMYTGRRLLLPVLLRVTAEEC